MSLGILGQNHENGPVAPEPPPPAASPYPVRAGYHRPQDTYAYYRWQPPVPFAQAHFGPPLPHAQSGLGAYYATRYNQPISGLGQACPPCSIWNGVACTPCPPGAELPECENCEGGMLIEEEQAPLTFWERSAFWGPVIVGTVTTIAGAGALAYVLREG